MVKTKVGKYLLNLIRKHFPPRHKFSKLFNGSTIKVSRSCMPDIKAEIYKHNKNTLEKAQQTKSSVLFGQGITKSIVCQANIMANIPGYKEKGLPWCIRNNI